MGRYKIRYVPYTPRYVVVPDLRADMRATPTMQDVVACLRGGVRLPLHTISKRTGRSMPACEKAVKRLYQMGLLRVYMANGAGRRGSPTLVYELVDEKV